MTTLSGCHDLKINKGSLKELLFTYYARDVDTGVETPIDLDGFYGASFLVANPTTGEIFLELTDLNGAITLGGATGEIRITITEEQSESMPFKVAPYTFKLMRVEGTEIRTIEKMTGKIYILDWRDGDRSNCC